MFDVLSAFWTSVALFLGAGIVILVIVEGKASSPEIRFESEPQLPGDEIVSP